MFNKQGVLDIVLVVVRVTLVNNVCKLSTTYYASSTFTLRPLEYSSICSITCTNMLMRV
jgi:hypothetical protein